LAVFARTAFAEIALSTLFDPEVRDDLMTIYEPKLRTLFESEILRVMTEEERKITGLTDVSLTLEEVPLTEFPKTQIDELGVLKVPLYSLAFLDDYVLASIAQQRIGHASHLPTSYLFYLTCPNLGLDRRSAMEFFGLPADVSLDRGRRQFADTMLQTLALWLMAYEAAKIIIPSAPEEFAIELFRRMGLPPFGVSVIMFMDTFSSGLNITTSEIETGHLDAATIAAGRQSAIKYTRILRLLHESSKSLARVPGLEEWNEREAQRLSTIQTQLEDGSLLNHYVQVCSVLSEATEKR
jgi:hypothetical protein